MPFLLERGGCRSRGPDRVRSPGLPLGSCSRLPDGGREPVERVAGTLGTIPATWRGGEAGPGRVFGISLVGRLLPRLLLLLPAIVSIAVTDTPLRAMVSLVGQVGCFLDPFRLPPELPERLVALEKGLLPLRGLLDLPPVEEDG